MLGNLKLVLLQHRKFLAIFFFIVFLPSITLAIFGIRSIRNERYKLLQQNLEQQRRFVKNFQEDVHSLIERDVSILREFSTSQAFIDSDYRAFSDLVSQRHKEKSLIGKIVIFKSENPSWLPSFKVYPSEAKAFIIPPEWRRQEPERASAERAEFQHKNYEDAISLYRQILERVEDNQVKAWINSRIARCELKLEEFNRAADTYRSIISDFPDLFTESGRPLGLVSRLELLDALRSDNNYDLFFKESFDTYKLLEENIWFLDGDQLKLYSAMLKNTIDESLTENSSDKTPDNYIASIKKLQNSIEEKLDVWRLAEDVRINTLPEMSEKTKNLTSDGSLIQKNSFEFDGSDVLVLLLPLAKERSNYQQDFLGSLIRFNDLEEEVNSLVKENSPPGISMILRSTQSGEIIFWGKESG